jgi:serine/threonine protein kinase
VAPDEKHPGSVDPGAEATDSTEYLDGGAGLRPGGADVVEPHERDERSPSVHRYLIGRTLGEGGMAVVHEATDVQLNRTVAIKRMHSSLTSRTDARQRFFAEAEILARLDHPGATSVFEAGRLPDGDCFYAMKKVSGRTLAALLSERTNGDLDDRTVRARFLEIFFRVCQTVASAHQQGVIHRDLKPENIMVDDLGVVYVMDWGLAKTLAVDADAGESDSARTRLGAVMGTPAYMSPEQAAGNSATSDRQTDVFSLGVMLYEILTGANPFRGETAVESMKGVMYHDPEAPRTRNRRINRTLSAITMKAIAKDPFRRYRSAVELAEDIRCYREFLPVSAIEPTQLEKLSNWSHRHPRLAAIAATLALVITLAGLFAGYQASVETAMVAHAHGYIDEIEARLTHIESEISAHERSLARMTEGPEREHIQRELANLEAELEVAEDERRSYALAIIGFTVLSPDERAIAILRQSTLDEIRTAIDEGHLYLARARILSAMKMYEEGNLFQFDEADFKLLRTELEKVETTIEASGLGPPPTALEATSTP